LMVTSYKSAVSMYLVLISSVTAFNLLSGFLEFQVSVQHVDRRTLLSRAIVRFLALAEPTVCPLSAVRGPCAIREQSKRKKLGKPSAVLESLGYVSDVVVALRFRS